MTVPPVITAITLRAALAVAERWLAAHRDAVNAINVYPVPDGDTGTNMLLTWRAALQAAAETPEGGAGPYLAALAHGALLGARGNSGVILSQMLAGLAHACHERHDLDGARLAAALTTAAEAADAAVTHPVEGTMLTVMRDAAGAARRVDASGGPAAVLRAAVGEAHASVARTPDLLPRLRDAGVVDAGGMGVALLLEGLLHGVTGEPLPAAPAPSMRATVDLAAVAHDGHGYCTEFVVLGGNIDRAAIEAALEACGGTSILVVGDGNAAHVHVHAADPGPALSIGVARGALAAVKVEDMQAQHERWRAGHAPAHAPAETGDLPAIGLVAVARGAGIEAAFRDLGATRVLQGGESGKASASELLEAARAAGRDHTVLLPNDRDVLMAAERAAVEAPGFITVIPTWSVAAGLAAAIAYRPSGAASAIGAAMAEAAAAVRSVAVSRAVRAATVDGVAVGAGDAIALVDGRLVARGETLEEALLAGLDVAGAREAEIVTLYLGADASADAGERAAARIAERYPAAQVETVVGGQPYYPYLAGVE
ncbi:MAG: DAK2 domain-containing protein [Dehalococcoidia bacterium]|nr:DAK2 domain-containing protein [Dehalococcoidia bacterium]